MIALLTLFLSFTILGSLIDIDPLAKDFDAFFNRMSGNSSGTSSTHPSSRGTWPPFALGARTNSKESSLSGLKGTLVFSKRKFGSLFTLEGDPVEGELDPVTNRHVSHLANYFFYAFESISAIIAADMDKLGLDDHYGLALKVYHNATFCLSHGLQDFSNISRARVKVENMRGAKRQSLS